MPSWFPIAFLALFVVGVGARLTVRAIPVRRWAATMTPLDAVVYVVGVVGLVAHCGSMFYPATTSDVPGSQPYMDIVNPLGTASVVAYAIPCVLVLVALRRAHPVIPGVVAAALTAVGITMYDGGPLDTHLATIFAAVVVLAVVSTVFTEVVRNRRMTRGVVTPV